MADYKYQGYTGKNTSLLKSLSKSSAAYAKYKEEEKVSENEQRIIDAQKEQAKKDERPWYEKTGEWIGNTVGPAADAVNKAAGDLFEPQAIKQLREEVNKNKPEAEKKLTEAVKEGKISQEEADSVRAQVEELTRDKSLTEQVAGGADMARQVVAGAVGGIVDTTSRVVETVDQAQTALERGIDDLNPTMSQEEKIAKGLIDGARFKGYQDFRQTVSDVTDTVAGADLNINKETDREAANIEAGKATGGEVFSAALKSLDVAGVGPLTKGAKALGDASKVAKSEAKLAKAAEAEAKLTPEEVVQTASPEQLQKHIEDFQAGKRSDNVEEDYNQYQVVKDELSRRERVAYQEAGGLSVADAQKALKDFDEGKNLPEVVYKPSEPVTSAAEVLLKEDVPAPMKEVATGITSTRKSIEDQMQGLMTPEAKSVELQRLDDAYGKDLEALNRKYSTPEAIPMTDQGGIKSKAGNTMTGGEYNKDVRYIAAKEKLDNSYRESLSELDLLEAQDADEVAAFATKLDDLKVHESQFLNDVNSIMEKNPERFKSIDLAERQAQREILQAKLAEAERFDNPKNVVTEVATSPDPVKSFNTNESAPEAFRTTIAENIDAIGSADESVVSQSFKHIDGVQASALRLMSPSQVLEKMGLRGTDLDLHSNIVKAESALNLANKADSETLTLINKSISKDPNAQRQIIDYIEGNRRTLTMPDAEAAVKIKAFLDEKKAGLEKLGFATMEDYFPHIFNKKDPDVLRLFKGKNTGEISFGNLKSRLTDSEDYSRDVMDVLATYASGYNRKTILEPALKPLGDIKTQVRLQEAEGKWIEGYIDQLMGFDTSKVGDGYNTFMDGVFEKTGMTNLIGKNHYAGALGTQRMVSAAATMGLNPGTAIRNGTQMVNTIAEIGPRYSAIGAVDGTRMLLTKAGREELQRVGIMDGGVSQNYFDAITKSGVRGRATKAKDASVKGLMLMIRSTDVSLRAQAYAGAKALARSKGLVGEAAENFAIRKAIDTQFITSRVDMPLAFNGQGVRSLTQLATFSGKQAGFLKRTLVGPDGLIKNADGTYSLNPKKAGNILAAIVTATAMTEALKPVIGMKETEWIPFYDQIAPIYGAVTGQEVNTGDGLYRSPLVTLLAGDGRNKTGLIQALQGEDTNDDGTSTMGEGFEKFFKDNWSQIIPAGTQIKKTTEGLQTTSTGVSKNAQGNIRFSQGTTTENKVTAGLFGQYATPQGRQWVKDGFPTLTEKQTATVNGNPQERQQYIDYFQTVQKASGRTKAYEAVKAELLKGNIAGAEREADEFNQKLTETMKSYWAKHDTMPEELQKEMLSKYINVQKTAKSQDIEIEDTQDD